MRLIINDTSRPYFNMAVEEYLLHTKNEDILLFWRNLSPTVVIGVNQNAYAELDVEYAKDNNIAVVRRLSGGGAVFHDSGNINFTMIGSEKGNFSDYRSFCSPIINALNVLGAKAEFSGRNDIVIDGLKISGNAQTMFKSKVMHHGTLLYKGDLTLLSKVLKPRDIKLQSKGIKSVRKRVANISEYIKEDLTEIEFMNKLLTFFDGYRQDLTSAEVIEIEKIEKDKYSKDEWNLGYSPKGHLSNEIKFDFGIVKVSFDIEKAKIKNVNFEGDFFSSEPIGQFSKQFENVDYDKEAVLNILKYSNCEKFISKSKNEDIIKLLFGGGRK